MRPRSLTRILAGGLVLVALLYLLNRQSGPTAAAPESFAENVSAAQDTQVETPSGPNPRLADPSPPQPAPHPSLDGTDVNGSITVDAEGRVVPHRDARRLFDYYLSLRGRMDADAIRALLRQHLSASHPPEVVAQALAMFDQYVALLDAEAKLAESWTDRELSTTEKVTSVLTERRHLRREHLGDALAEAFYQDQETYESYQLERMKISTNPNLTPEQKAAAFKDAEIMLTEEQREIRRQTFAWLDVKQLARQPVDSLDAESAQAIRQRFGDNALDRLAAVEQERLSWEQKREAWLAEMARIQALRDLSHDEKQAKLMDYAREHLNASEIRRMQTLDSDQAAL